MTMATRAVDFVPGSVWLVGAGPGDPELLTLRAARAIEQADVILFDALLGPEILGLARGDAQLVCVGKRAGRPSPSQDWINDQLVRHARMGARVLRLKGGDPFVFGRGGEEALALAAADVPWRVVPGISAGIGGLAAAGIPVTHRGQSSAVTFVTGQDRNRDLPPEIDWRALAAAGGTIVVYMGRKTAGEIAQRLIAGGMAADTPAAIVIDATQPSQFVRISRLECLADDLAETNAAGPALLVIGAVAALAQQLNPALGHCVALDANTLDAAGVLGQVAGTLAVR